MGCRNLLIVLGLGLLPIISTHAKPQADIHCAADIAGCCCRGDRGNVDCDFNDVVDIVDLTLLIDHMYITLEPLPSFDEANIDGQDQIDIADLTGLIDYLFVNLTPPPPCPGGFVNHPPVTILLGIDSSLQPYVNAETPTPTNPGVHYSWIGHDKLDHPYEPEPLSFEWRVYGPYDQTTINQINTQFVKIVFVTTSREMIYRGQGRFLPYCDTTWIPTPPYLMITCDTMWVDTVHLANRFGVLDTIFDVESPAFINNPSYDKMALRSGAFGDSVTADTSTFLRDFFAKSPSDTTQLGSFIFWVRAIDHDSPPKADPAPAFKHFQAVDGKHELDILIADAGISYEINPRNLTKARQYWSNALPRWRPGTTQNYHIITQSSGNVLPLTLLLKHKVVIVVSDDVIKGVLNTPDLRKRCIVASNAGSNFWIMGRTSIAGDEARPPSIVTGSQISGIAPWLGINQYVYTGWSWYYIIMNPSVRIEDFIGADPINPAAWPVLTVDSALLHQRYGWGGDYFPPWIPSLSALPEVTYFTPNDSAEILYNYNSLYTDHHPLVPDNYFFDGKPVVYRIDRGGYRLFVSAFTPYSLGGDSIGGAAQTFVDSTLNWLYQPFESNQSMNSNPNRLTTEKIIPGIVKPTSAAEVKQ